MTTWASDLRLGPYVLVAPIGAGGMGEVWKARDTRLDRLVAVKRLLSPSSPRFEIEARAIAALNHPHICQIYDVGPDYLVLEYIARTSAFAFKGKQEDIRRIAEILDVAYVVEGTVRKAGNRVRVTAQLISARDGGHIWSKRYDRELADVFAIQDEIAQAIGVALHSLVGGTFATHQRSTPHLPAYEAMLRAHHHRYNNSDFARSLACLEEAIALDPDFAFAHSALGDHFLLMFTWQVMPAHDAAPLARRHAQRALEIDPSLSEAHSILGCIAALYDYDWAEADRRFRMAFAHGTPSHPVRMQRVNYFLAHWGRGHEGIPDMEQAMMEDPLDWFPKWGLAVAYRSVGRDDEADTQFAQLLVGGQLSAIPAVVLSGDHLARGHKQEALAFR